MTEKELQASIIEAARHLGLIVYHTYNSIGSEPGWPDLTIVGARGILFREIKSEKGRLTLDQVFWIESLRKADMNADVWRPGDWPDRIIPDLRALGRVEIPRPRPTPAQLRRQLAGRRNVRRR